VAQHLNYDELMDLGAANPSWKEDIKKDFTIPRRYSRSVLLSQAWREKPTYVSQELFKASLLKEVTLHSFMHAILSLQCDEHGSAVIVERLDQETQAMQVLLQMGATNAPLDVIVDITDMNTDAELLKMRMDAHHAVVYSKTLALVINRKTGTIKHRCYKWNQDVSLQRRNGALFTVMPVRQAADLRVVINRLHENGNFEAEPYSPISVEDTTISQLQYGDHDFYLTHSHLLVTWNHTMDPRTGGLFIVELATKKTLKKYNLLNGGIRPFKNSSPKTFTTAGKVILPEEVRCFKINHVVWLFNEWTGTLHLLGSAYGLNVEYSRHYIAYSWQGTGMTYAVDLREGFDPLTAQPRWNGIVDFVPQMIVGDRFLVLANGEAVEDHELYMSDLSALRPGLLPIGKFWVDNKNPDYKVSLRTMRIAASGDGFVVSLIRGKEEVRACEEGVMIRYTFENVARMQKKKKVSEQ